MKERPILFNADMVRAILDGRKTQTRRPVKPQPVPFGEDLPFTQAPLKQHIGKPWMPVGGVFQDAWKKPFGTVGDRLWVRETWGLMAHHDPTDWHRGSVCGMMEDHVGPQFAIEHRANWKLESDYAHWRPSIHMPRWASRIDLEITRVWVERVQDITEEDAKAEGVIPDDYEGYEHPDNPTLSCAAHRYSFRDLWQSIYGTWDANPLVWAYEFRRVKP